jgi:hypothetical protein
MEKIIKLQLILMTWFLLSENKSKISLMSMNSHTLLNGQTKYLMKIKLFGKLALDQDKQLSLITVISKLLYKFKEKKFLL